ncbi:SLATT domain-containing protein [Priestia koreensis]|uniref:SLATT domain-containing protein n=1 Tax=Priestia koreensis TaxID=284581 RepID=UPI003CFCC8EF
MNNLTLIKASFERVLYTHKTHEKAVERLENKSKLMKILQIIFLVLTSTGVLTQLGDVFKDADYKIFINLFIVIVTLIATGLSIYDLGDNTDNLIREHKKVANDLLRLRDRYISIIVDIQNNNFEDNEIKTLRDKLSEEAADTYNNAPSTTSKDYQKAAESLKNNGEFTFDESEVDRYLP